MAAIIPDTPDKSMDCTMHALPTAKFRFNQSVIHFGKKYHFGTRKIFPNREAKRVR
jgi:hypothetical protein